MHRTQAPSGATKVHHAIAKILGASHGNAIIDKKSMKLALEMDGVMVAGKTINNQLYYFAVLGAIERIDRGLYRIVK